MKRFRALLLPVMMGWEQRLGCLGSHYIPETCHCLCTDCQNSNPVLAPDCDFNATDKGLDSNKTHICFVSTT